MNLLLVVLLLVEDESGGVSVSRPLSPRYAQFFRDLGRRIRACRVERKLTQEDMIGFGFSARYWQMIEAGRPITMYTLLRVSDTFGIPLEKLVEGLIQPAQETPAKR